MFKTVSEGFYKQNYEFCYPLLCMVCKKFNIKVDDWYLKSMEENPTDNSNAVGQTWDKHLYISTKRISIKDGNEYAAFICCHELGHVRQFNNHEFSDVYYRNMDMRNFDYLSRPCEQDATLFALSTHMFDFTKIQDETFQVALKQIYIDKLLKPILGMD